MATAAAMGGIVGERLEPGGAWIPVVQLVEEPARASSSPGPRAATKTYRTTVTCDLLLMIPLTPQCARSAAREKYRIGL